MSALFTAVESYLITRDSNICGTDCKSNTELREIGNRLMRLGSKLADSPENVCFDGRPIPADFFVSSEFTFAQDDVNYERIAFLIDEKRDICRTLTALNRESEELVVAPDGSRPGSRLCGFEV